MQTFRMDDLPTFLAIARTGTLSGAAQAVGVNPSTAFRRLENLEAALRTRLFDRTRSPYALTPAGRLLLSHAERIEEEALRIERVVGGLDRELAGVVQVSLVPSVLAELAPDLVAFREAYPRIVLSLHVDDRLVDLARREADVAFRPSLRAPDDAVAWRMADVAWAHYGPSSSTIDPGWIGFDDTLSHLAASRWLERNVAADRFAARVSTVDAAGVMLATGLVQGLLPCHLGDHLPRLARRTGPIDELRSRLWLLIHVDLRKNARVGAFVEFMKSRFERRRASFEGGTPVDASVVVESDSH